MSAHGQTAVHWVPPEGVTEDQVHMTTACGLDIDGTCDKHRAEGVTCQYGLAWTRSTDLAAMQSRPYEDWPPPCPVCEKEIDAAEAGPF